MTALAGRWDPAFSEVVAVLADALLREGAGGAALVVRAGGRPVVDVWGGVADARTGRAWEEDTVAMGFSVAKGAVAALCCRLAQVGVLDLDEPVAARWPGFAVHGKEGVTLRWVLSHRAGLPAVRVPLEPADLVAGRPLVEALAAEVPWWEPGTTAGYHPVTFGHLVGEVLLRTTGRSLGTLLREHVAGPWGLDLWVGLPDAVRPRLARLQADEGGEGDGGDGGGPAPGSLAEAAFANPPLAVPSWNSPALLRAEIPAVNAVGTARAWAALYGACLGAVEGRRLLAAEWLEAGRTTEYRGPDRVQEGEELHVGLGFRLPTSSQPLLGPGSFGHAGTGGAIALGSPEADVALAFLPNHLRPPPHEDRVRDALLAAVRDAL